MNPMIDPLMMELDMEAATTRRVLERIPADKYSWKPHPKSYSMGQLALHTASVPGALSHLLTNDSFEVQNFQQDPPKTQEEVLGALDTAVANTKVFLQGLTPERAVAMWELTNKGKQILCAPRIALVRSLVFNHWYHHRGQLLVYMRLLDLPVPSVYGPTADENPFA